MGNGICSCPLNHQIISVTYVTSLLSYEWVYDLPVAAGKVGFGRERERNTVEFTETDQAQAGRCILSEYLRLVFGLEK